MKKISSFGSKTFKASVLAAVSLAALAGCDLTQNQLKMDRSANMEFQDFRDAMGPRELPPVPKAESDIPELEPYIAGVSDQLKPMPLVSISVNQTIPLRDALFELAKQADYDLELDPRITGSIIFTARNRPFDLVIDKISAVAGLRYKFDEGSLRVELDTPYTQNYKLDYLSFVRKNSGQISTNVAVQSGESSVTSNSGSNFSISSEFESNFWGELEANLKQIVDSNSVDNSMRTAADPAITVTASNPSAPVMPLPVPPLDESALNDGIQPQAGDEHSSSTVIKSKTAFGQQAPADEATAEASTDAPAADSAAPADAAQPTSLDGNGAQGATPQAPSSVLQVNSLPADAAGGSGDGSATPTAGSGGVASISINRQAGLVSVYANERVQKKIAEYMDAVRKSVSSQVLIEARVLEVTLKDEFAAGVDWQHLDDVATGFSFDLSAGIPAMEPPTTNNLSLGYLSDSGDIGAVAQLLSRFGTVHALASPRVTVLNNQSAVLSVAENQVYFDLDFEREEGEDGAPDTINIESEIRNVPEGVLINVLPSIDLERQQISMQVRPTVTKITQFVEDPAAALFIGQFDDPDLENVTSLIPVLNVQEIDSVVKMDSGKVVVMGGLLQDRSESEQQGVPVLSETPLIGGLFRNQGDSVNKTELVIFLKATILNSPSDSVHNTDRELYKLYSQDRRPVKM